MRTSLVSSSTDFAPAVSGMSIAEDRDFGELVIRQQLKVGGMILLELDRLSNEMEADAVWQAVSAHGSKLLAIC